MNCLVHHYDLTVFASQTEVEHALQFFAFCNFMIKLSEIFLKFYPIKTVIIDYMVSDRGARNLSTLPIVSSSFCGGPDINPPAGLVMNQRKIYATLFHAAFPDLPDYIDMSSKSFCQSSRQFLDLNLTSWWRRTYTLVKFAKKMAKCWQQKKKREHWEQTPGTPNQEMLPLLTRNQYLLKASNTILDF